MDPKAKEIIDKIKENPMPIIPYKEGMSLEERIACVLRYRWSFEWGREVAYTEKVAQLAIAVEDHCKAQTEYLVSEVCYLQQRVEDLEIDLMLERQEDWLPNNPIKIKRGETL